MSAVSMAETTANLLVAYLAAQSVECWVEKLVCSTVVPRVVDWAARKAAMLVAWKAVPRVDWMAVNLAETLAVHWVGCLAAHLALPRVALMAVMTAVPKAHSLVA